MRSRAFDRSGRLPDLHGRALAVLLIGSAITLDLSWSVVQVNASPRAQRRPTFVAPSPPPLELITACRPVAPRVRVPRVRAAVADDMLATPVRTPAAVPDCSLRRARHRAVSSGASPAPGRR